jgi:pyrroloquinoline-quinone synthase
MGVVDASIVLPKGRDADTLTRESGPIGPLDGPDGSRDEHLGHVPPTRPEPAHLDTADRRVLRNPSRSDRVCRRRRTVEQPLGRDEFATALRSLRGHYWDSHPFHRRLHDGGTSPTEVRRWVANRWYYQECLAQKNAAIVANCPLPEIRRLWLPRASFYDGPDNDVGGRRDWLALADAVGVTEAELVNGAWLLRGVRFAVDGYLTFCRTRPWLESVAAALTELFSPDHMSERVVAWRRHYDWIKPDGYAYFERRIPAARSDSVDTLDIVLTYCVTRAQQDAAIAALAFKCDVLNAMLDAIDYAGRS